MKIQGTMTIILNDKNEVLIAKRHKKKKIAPNRWNFIGGHVEENESIEESAAREILEEVNLNVSNLIKIDEFHANWDNYKFNCHLFITKIIDNSKIKINREHSEFIYVDFKDLWKYNIVGFPTSTLNKILLEFFLNEYKFI